MLINASCCGVLRYNYPQLNLGSHDDIFTLL
jgi:hypothetical protein